MLGVVPAGCVACASGAGVQVLELVFDCLLCLAPSLMFIETTCILVGFTIAASPVKLLKLQFHKLLQIF